LTRLNVAGDFRRLGCSLDFEVSLGTSGIFEAVVVLGMAEELEVLATTEAIEVVLFRGRGVFEIFDVLQCTGKDEAGFLEIADS
jgi:hypothetical protein